MFLSVLYFLIGAVPLVAAMVLYLVVRKRMTGTNILTDFSWWDSFVTTCFSVLAAALLAWSAFVVRLDADDSATRAGLARALASELQGNYANLLPGSRTAIVLATKTGDANLAPLSSTVLLEAARSGLFPEVPTSEMFVISTYVANYNARSQRVSDLAFLAMPDSKDTTALLLWEGATTSQGQALKEYQSMLKLKIRWLYIALKLSKEPFMVGSEWYALGWAHYPDQPWDVLGPPDTTCRSKLPDPEGYVLPDSKDN